MDYLSLFRRILFFRRLAVEANVLTIYRNVKQYYAWLFEKYKFRFTSHGLQNQLAVFQKNLC